jgi:hypothetical protein
MTKNAANSIIKNKNAIMKKQRERGIFVQQKHIKHLFFDSFNKNEFSVKKFSIKSSLFCPFFSSSFVNILLIIII